MNCCGTRTSNTFGGARIRTTTFGDKRGSDSRITNENSVWRPCLQTRLGIGQFMWGSDMHNVRCCRARIFGGSWARTPLPSVRCGARTRTTSLLWGSDMHIVFSVVVGLGYLAVVGLGLCYYP